MVRNGASDKEKEIKPHFVNKTDYPSSTHSQCTVFFSRVWGFCYVSQGRGSLAPPNSGYICLYLSADHCPGTHLRSSAPFELVPCISGRGRGGCQATEDAPSAGFRRRGWQSEKRVALLDTGGSAQPLLQTPAQFSDLLGSL